MKIIENFNPQEVSDNFTGIIILPGGIKSYFSEGEFIFNNKYLYSAPDIKYLENSPFYNTFYLKITDVEQTIVIEDNINPTTSTLFKGYTIAFKKILTQNGIGYLPYIPGY